MTIGPTSGTFSTLPSARSYQVCLPNFWPGIVIIQQHKTHIALISTIRSLAIYGAADKVTVGGMELPYAPLKRSFASYVQDSWTYDGR